MHPQRGFTLTELLVTLALIGTVGAAAAIAIKPSNPIVGMVANITVEHRHVRNFAAGGATSADAIAAGFPPDFRGRILSKLKICPGNDGAELPPGTDLGIACTKSGGSVTPYYLEVRAERLRVGGTLETLSKTYVPTTSGSTKGALHEIYYTPSANLTRGLPCNGSQCASDNNFTTNRYHLLAQEEYAMLLGTTQFGDITDINLRCYANGTCDPVTYWFIFKDGAKYKFSRVVVTATGLVTSVPSWGPL